MLMIDRSDLREKEERREEEEEERREDHWSG
jgi:hypothetical protein